MHKDNECIEQSRTSSVFKTTSCSDIPVEIEHQSTSLSQSSSFQDHRNQDYRPLTPVRLVLSPSVIGDDFTPSQPAGSLDITDVDSFLYDSSLQPIQPILSTVCSSQNLEVEGEKSTSEKDETTCQSAKLHSPPATPSTSNNSISSKCDQPLENDSYIRECLSSSPGDNSEIFPLRADSPTLSPSLTSLFHINTDLDEEEKEATMKRCGRVWGKMKHQCSFAHTKHHSMQTSSLGSPSTSTHSISHRNTSKHNRSATADPSFRTSSKSRRNSIEHSTAKGTQLDGKYRNEAGGSLFSLNEETILHSPSDELDYQCGSCAFSSPCKEETVISQSSSSPSNSIHFTSGTSTPKEIASINQSLSSLSPSSLECNEKYNDLNKEKDDEFYQPPALRQHEDDDSEESENVEQNVQFIKSIAGDDSVLAEILIEKYKEIPLLDLILEGHNQSMLIWFFISSFETALNEIISQVDEQLELIPSPPQSHLQPKSFAIPSSAQTFLREQPLPNEPRKVLSGSSAHEFEISPLNSFLRSSATCPQSSLNKEKHHLPHSHSSKGSEFTFQQEKSFISPSIPQEKGRSPPKTIIKRLHPAFVSRVSKERDYLPKQHFTASLAVLSINDEGGKDTSNRSNNWSTRWDSQQHPQDLLDGCEAGDIHVIEKRPAFASVPSLLLPSSSSNLTPSNTHPPDNVPHLFPTPSPQQLLWDDDPGRCRYPGSLAAIERTRSANEKKNCRNSDKNEGEKKEGVSNDVPSLTQNEEDDILCCTPPPLIPPAIAWTKLKTLSIDATAPPVLDVRKKDERRKEEEERQKRIDLLQSGETNLAKGDKCHETHKGVSTNDLQKNSSNSVRITPHVGKASCSSHEQCSECSIPSSDQAGLFPPISSLSLMAQLHDPPQTSLIPPSPQISFPAIPFNPSDVARWDSLTKTNCAQYVQGGDNSSWVNENRERSGERTESAVTEDSTNQKAKERKLRQFVKETDDPHLFHLMLRKTRIK
ncbi:uncharacterized protein MONOS_7809 [Monocercomonoides exilis]|uniref:uncharacterized protein n=1 Tax=Monocercomonoides exilis TaxID=2049356 RepID=UPI003559EB40|nr:hypothetical protein MONOS_7809 [Monocercomonoides exilis]|eukprot:MONOS_7809.1-p1 / transcript=MONOS_7809.1 / gene=MONOS_7809 / organism=Monocercomonoides_exilis_PA203 / gene_product=unspecified product / transcript_product=unspecified product / location=Mono_scaffold00277:23407-26979(-) / protein_length=989 / sequence_SO=supercontig / SO=protein_coding / is_pseudo=false